ncbi:unnamed protein product [Mycena citricolor]|uniref:Phosphatidylserine decarboxylase proenzyme 2 n=1 Tax=Mycena citricolor TaxID=2018698 RepID=A0AAD2H3W9_9AGAR|nr:unnamed protein product [Mycena citricolor]
MSTPAAKKHPRLRRALKLGFGGTPAIRRNTLAPRAGEQPIVYLRIQVLGGQGLVAKDRNGLSDPFVVASLARTRHQTPVAKKTLNPVYAPKDATWDFPIHLSVADRLGVVELVVWDKDSFKKEYLGEVDLGVEDWFADRPKAWDAPGNVLFTVPVLSTRPGTPSQGSLQIRLGFVSPPPPTAGAPNQAAVDFDALYRILVKNRRSSLVSAPPTEGVGTMRSHMTAVEFEDDGGISSASEISSDDEDGLSDLESGDEDERESPLISSSSSSPAISTDVSPSGSKLQSLYVPPTMEATPTVTTKLPVLPSLNVIPGSPASDMGTSAGGKTPTGPSPLTTPTPSSAGVPASISAVIAASPSAEIAPEKKGRPKFIPIPIPRKFLPGKSRSRPTTPNTPDGFTTPITATGKEKRGFRKSWSGTGALATPGEDAAPAKSKGKEKEAVGDAEPGKMGRRRQKPERAYSLGTEVAPSESPSDIVGIVMLEIVKAEDLPRLKNMTRTSFDMDPFVVISFGKKVFRTRVIRHSLNPVWDEKLLFHVRRYEIGYEVRLTVLDWDKLTSNDYVGEVGLKVGELVANAPQPLPADPSDSKSGHIPVYSDETGDHSMKEFTMKLEIGAGGVQWESKHSPAITFRAKYQPYSLLRQRFWRQYLKQYDADETGTVSHVELTSMLDSLGSTLSSDTVDSFFTRFGKDPVRDELSVEQAIRCLESEVLRPESERRRVDDEGQVAGVVTSAGSSPSGGEMQLGELDFAGPALDIDFVTGEPQGFVTEPSEMSPAAGSPAGSEDSFERVINVKNCPICHRPRMSDKAEVDIITHIAVCASQDWSSNSANIIVQNRLTGQLEEEKMQVYVRLGIRLLYKGMNSRMEGGRARRLLRSMTVKQGLKYDSPESARDIPVFIEFHKLKVDEILEPLDSFKTFNQFFYRKLKPTARPVAEPDDPYRLVSSADCRMMAFETVSEATRLWIKGREFTVGRLLGETYSNEVDRYAGGALAIFRLAPQDYHRFHSPVDGTIGKMTTIAGEYYTVNPQAIRTALDVYGENARKIVPIDSPQFGRVMAVCVGAMMVGSILTTVQEGESVKRGQEFGYFAFGGSTIVLLFEKDAVEWDEDLLVNGRASLETLVRVGMGVGRGKRKPVGRA